MAEDPAGPALAARLKQLRELLDQANYPDVIPALVRHLDHSRTREGAGAKLAEAAWLLAYTLDLVVTDTLPGRRSLLRIDDRPGTRAPRCPECAPKASTDER